MQLQTSISLCILKIVTHHKLNYICNFVLCNSMILGRDARDEVSTHSAIVSELESSINALQYERDNAFKQLGDVLSSHCDEEVMSKLSCEKDELASAIEALTAKLNIKEANHKQCMEELERVKGECCPAFFGNLAHACLAIDIESLFLKPPPPAGGVSDFVRQPFALDRVYIKRGFCFVYFKDAPNMEEKRRTEDFVDCR